MGHFPAVRIGGSPKDLAGLRLHGEQQGVIATGGEDNRALIKQRALAGIPGGHGGAELARQIQSPQEFAGD